MLSAATSCLLVETNSPHEYATDLAGQISDGTAHAAGGDHAASASVRTGADQSKPDARVFGWWDCYSWNGTTGNQSPQKCFDSVSAPGRYCIHPVKDKLFSGDVEKATKSAREAHRHSNKSTPSTSGQRHHPYKRQPYGRPFFFFFFF